MKMLTGIIILVVLIGIVCIYQNKKSSMNMNTNMNHPFNSNNNNIVLVASNRNIKNCNQNKCVGPKSAQELRQTERKPESFNNLPLPLKYNINGKPNNFDMAYANSTLLILP